MTDKKEIRKELIKKRAELRLARKEFDKALKTNDLVTIQHAQDNLNDALYEIDQLRDNAQDDIGITQMRRSKKSDSFLDRVINVAGTDKIVKKYSK